MKKFKGPSEFPPEANYCKFGLDTKQYKKYGCDSSKAVPVVNPRTHWTSPKIFLIFAMNDLRGCLAAGCKARLVKEWNENCAYPLVINPKAPWSEQIKRKFNYKVWVVEMLRDDIEAPKVPFMVHMLNIILYPLKFIPRKSVLLMPEYKLITFSVGAVCHGYRIEFHVPKNFSFNDNFDESIKKIK